MPRVISLIDLTAIEQVVAVHPQGVSFDEIKAALGSDVAQRTLQYRLAQLVKRGRLMTQGKGRWTRYLPQSPEGEVMAVRDTEVAMRYLSAEAVAIQRYLEQPVLQRKPVGYNRDFLERYQPNVTAYLSQSERAHLKKVGALPEDDLPAGTFAKHIYNRLLIDLSWNSSRLEGNTYSLLETARLINLGVAPEGGNPLEAQMILNHKDAIAFLVNNAADIGFNRPTIFNLHGLLASGLLVNSDAEGQLRKIPVGIGKSAFHPLNVPQQIEEAFDQILLRADAITDPFEQAFFAFVQLPYLQPFEDVNKRVSRLAANIPLIKSNFAPLSFTDVSTDTYKQGVLGVYELNDIALLKEVFIAAYEQSAERYPFVRNVIGTPDQFRLKYRRQFQQLFGEIIRRLMDRRSALAHVEFFTTNNVDKADQQKFREVAESELGHLNEGNFARYQITIPEFRAWEKVWGQGV